MSKRTSLTIKYALAHEIFFVLICGVLVGVEYFWGSGEIKLKGVLYCLVIFQIPVFFLTVRHWFRLGKDSFIN
jgi:hypothetical protein